MFVSDGKKIVSTQVKINSTDQSVDITLPVDPSLIVDVKCPDGSTAWGAQVDVSYSDSDISKGTRIPSLRKLSKTTDSSGTITFNGITAFYAMSEGKLKGSTTFMVTVSYKDYPKFMANGVVQQGINKVYAQLREAVGYGTISGKLMSIGGKPLDSNDIAELDKKYCGLYGEKNFIINPDGTFKLIMNPGNRGKDKTGKVPLYYALNIWIPNYKPTGNLIDSFIPGENVDLGTIVLERGKKVCGHVVDQDGNPIPNAAVTINVPYEVRNQGLIELSADETGYFESWSLAGDCVYGVYAEVAGNENVEGDSVGNITSANSTDLRIVLRILKPGDEEYEELEVEED